MFPGTVSKLSESTLPVATVINVKTDITNIIGSGTISSINPPGVICGRSIVLVSLGGSITLDGTVNNGNIAGAAASIAANKSKSLHYSKTTRKWHVNV